MVEWTQAYHYTKNCPLRRLTQSPLKDSIVNKWFSTYAHPFIMKMFFERDYVTVSAAFAKHLKDTGMVVKDAGLKLSLFQNALLNTLMFISARSDVPIERKEGIFEVQNMKGEVNLIRKKANQTVELIWVRYDTVLPDAKDRDILAFYANWNARAYELYSKVRPYTLTIYYPLIGDSIQYQYNFLNGLDVVADLIQIGVYYANPTPVRCRACRGCSEHLRM